MSRFIQFLAIWPDPTHWPTHLTTHPHTHPWVGVSLQIINLQTELNYLDSVNIFKIFSILTWPHPSTHPTTHQTIHPPMGGEFFTDFKSSNRIEISWLVQVLSNFNWFRGSPRGVVDGWMGVGLCQGVWEGAPCMYAHACTCTHTCACERWCHNGIPQDFPMGAAICMKLSCLYMHACAHVHMNKVPPKHSDRVPPPIHPLPPPKGGPLKSVKSQ